MVWACSDILRLVGILFKAVSMLYEPFIVFVVGSNFVFSLRLGVDHGLFFLTFPFAGHSRGWS